MKKGLFIYPWDIIDTETEKLSEELREIGVCSISLAVAYHQAKVLLPHNPKRRIFVHKGGSCYFPFNDRDYSSLKPMAAELLTGCSGEFLKGIIEVFHKKNMEVNAWTVVFHNSRLALSHPECAIHNAYGEPSPNALCPSNEEAYRYGLQILTDIASAGVDAVNTESVDYAGFLHGDHHEMYAYENVEMLERLLGICFCESCIKRSADAGMDVKKLQNAVILLTEKFLNFEKVDLTAIYESLESYKAVQRSRITMFYQDLKTRIAGNNLKTRIVPIVWLAGGCDPGQYGVDAARVAEQTDGFIAAYPDTPADVAGFVSDIRKAAPLCRELTGGIRLMAPQTVRPQQVKEYMGEYRKNGIEKIIFYNYGLSPQLFLDEIRGG